MMTFDPLLRTWTPVYGPEDSGASGAAGGGSSPSPTPAGDTGGQAAGATSDAKAGADADAGAPPADKSEDSDAQAPDKKASDDQGSTDTEGDGQGDDTAASPTEFNLDVPEDLQAYAPQVEAYSEAAKGFLSENPDATAVDALKWAMGYQAQAVEEQTEAQSEQLSAQVEKWNATLEKDPEIGGDKFDENKAIARKAIDDLDDPDLKEFLAVTGYGSHPSLVRLALRAGLSNKEADVLGSAPGKGKKSLTKALYGNS